MRDRPLYIGFICWFLVLSSFWALIHSFPILDSPATAQRMAHIPLPKEVQVAKFFSVMIVPLVCGGFMLEGANWARVVYITWGILNYLTDAYFFQDRREFLPGLPIFALASILLLLPRARAYFLLPQHHT